MVLITSWKQCIQAVEMEMTSDVIHTLILLWKSAQMLTWLRTRVIQFAEDQKNLKRHVIIKSSQLWQEERKVSGSHSCALIALHPSYCHWRNKYISCQFYFLPAASDSGAATSQSLPDSLRWLFPLTELKLTSLETMLFKPGTVYLPPRRFSCQGLLHCWASPPYIYTQCLLRSLTLQSMRCSLTANIQINLYRI